MLKAWWIWLVSVAALVAPLTQAEEIKVSVIKSIAGGPLHIARERSYFAAENLSADIAFFYSSQPVALAVISSDLAFGVTGFSRGFYALGA